MEVNAQSPNMLVTLAFPISEVVEHILVVAMQTDSIRYWGYLNAKHDNYDEVEEYTPDGWKYSINDAETDAPMDADDIGCADYGIRDLTIASLRDGIEMFINRSPNLFFRTTDWHRDDNERWFPSFDGDAVDSIIQYALFGELIFG